MHLGLRLAAVNSREDNLALLVALQHVGPHQQGPWYIAGTDLGEDGKYVWITTDQSVGFGTGYSNWGPDQPDNYLGGEHCIEVGAFKGSHWNDVDCNTNRAYICERIDN
ncbi:galactose-specific lectin nattectin-like [Culex quinquefasciatus]|uniref:galactose-specific lectin nattectin-like n=1 Tax=Culex quinquefasciatus TaxID=7176 RepID=UPI0018E2E03D|nr:galactose-specific lectin nattectin-like [Culex quinquefasciatus]